MAGTASVYCREGTPKPASPWQDGQGVVTLSSPRSCCPEPACFLQLPHCEPAPAPAVDGEAEPRHALDRPATALGEGQGEDMVVSEPRALEALGWLSSVTRSNGALCLSETLRGIQVLGPTLIQTFQKMTVTLNFLGR